MKTSMAHQKNYTSLQKRVILSASIGTILEWYDFAIYAFLAAVFAKLFFQNLAPTVALMFSYGVFAIGYIARPIGAMLFGHLGDTQGRQKSLSITLLLMAGATFGIGLLPSYETAGIAAPILLVVLRLLQGIAIGGESFGSVCFTIESIPPKRTGFYSALVWSSSSTGMLLASVVVFITFVLFQGSSLYTFGWRLPFLLAALGGVIGSYVRYKTSETPIFQCLVRDKLVAKFPLKTIFLSHKSLVAQLFGLYLLSALITYIAFIFMPVYFSEVLGHSRVNANAVNTVMLISVVVLFIFFGFLSDKIGRKPIMLTAACGFAILSYPLYCFISHGNIVALILAQAVFTLLSAGFQGPLMALTIDLIPVNIRYSLGSLSYNLAYSIFGGTVPLVAMFLITKTHNVAIPGLYLAAGAVVAILSLLFSKVNLPNSV